MQYVVTGFLWISILLYLLLAGADFGAGILEFFSSPKSKIITRKLMYRIMGPIWEANHMWLIISIVILFVGFPAVYTTVSVYLHIPLVLMLMGIIARGTAFSFRNYDAVKDEMQIVYSRIFVYASILTPLFLGIIAGSIVSGKIDPAANTFMGEYIYDWLNWFPLSVGLFTVFICGFLASVYLIGESDTEEQRKLFFRRTRNMNVGAFVSGSMVLLAARSENVPLFHWLFGNLVSAAAIISALVSLVVFWFHMNKRKSGWLRILAAFQLTMIFIAVTYSHYPNIVLFKNGSSISLNVPGDNHTIKVLGWALLIGGIFILPAVFYLIYSFTERKINSSYHEQE
jgi:cytochrome d ubiquinol oxidase subunit II